jgi:hypothetical protein
MANTYSWVIVQLDCSTNIPEVQDYVVTAHWRYGISNGSISTDMYGSTGFSINPKKPNFIPFEDLTENDVISWLEDSLDVPSMQSTLDTQLENIINPPIIVLPLPWVSK